MAIAHTGSSFKIKVARTYRGKCGICFKPVIGGEAYVDGVGGTNTLPSYTAHYNCYKPASAPPR